MKPVNNYNGKFQKTEREETQIKILFVFFFYINFKIIIYTLNLFRFLDNKGYILIK